MKIKEFFRKDINREIETVIKADDRENISTEVAEYVVTKEISKKIRDLFQAYNNYRGINGVWISGFFGSGKSHLLKILSYALENKEVDGYNCGELFAERIEDDEILKGDVERAAKIPSESILFNIDQQAQITSKADENAILSVFYKVFYDHLGYYGFRPHVAEFEMWLDKKGKYETFKKRFQEVHELSWEEARLDYHDPLVTDDAAEVLGEIFGKDAAKYEDILDEMEDKHKQSIEDFSNRVNDYIQTKPAGFRLNFFVDEVGQYISDNTKLMLNLQTIAESLATITKGRSWVLVTSQEDMEKVIGDMTKQQENDFSRIQARFGIKVNLTSANVDEVIEKRLLKKQEEAQQHLEQVYTKEKAHLDTLLSFSEAGVQFKGYRGEEDFANKYPFVPFHFDLFQQCRRALSAHNAFQGKHSSVGERSMLGVFQQVIQGIEEQDDRTLVSFDKMYNGIKNELRGESQQAIILAEKNLDSEFAIQVLKALFLVKYYGNFKTTKRNISVLMLDSMDVDLNAHKKKVDEALNKLENQSYIQRNGELYEYLTNEEKDIEVEIKNTDVDDQAVTQFLREVFYDEIISENKLRYLENKQDYDFTSKIDGITLGREKELEIEIITENYHEFTNTGYLQSQTMGSTGMKLVLPPDATFVKDLKMYLKTDKYVKQNRSTSNTSEVKRIHEDKSRQNVERKKNLRFQADKLLAEATVYLNGSKHEMPSTADGKTRVVKAFQDLVKIVYPNLRMLQGIQFSEETFKNVIRNPQDDLFGADDSTMSEAESRVLSFVVRRRSNHERTSLQEVKENFTRKPYGWYPNAVWTIIAKLYKRGKLELKQGPDVLEDEMVIGALMNSSYHNNVLLEQQEEIDPKQVQELKRVFTEAFDESCPYTDPKEVAKAFKEKLQLLLTEVSQLQLNAGQYPFLGTLQPLAEKLKRWTHKETGWFIGNIGEFEDDLLDAKEDVLDPVRIFMNGEQRKIYDEVRNILKADTSNFIYVEGEELKQMQQLLDNNRPYAGNAIREAKQAKDALLEKLQHRLQEEKDKAKKAIFEGIADLEKQEEFSGLEARQQEELLQPFHEQLQKVEGLRYISQLRELKSRVEDRLVEQQLNAMVRLSVPVTEDAEGVEEPAPHYISRSSIRVAYEEKELKTEEDVDAYVEALRETFKEQIKQNRRIRL